MNKTQLLFLIILIEGYVVLATELLAIRTLIPFVGSGTETVSIIISAVLLPLAIGYHVGGNAFKNAFAKAKLKSSKKLSIRKLLLKNVASALIVLSLGLSYIFQELFFAVLKEAGIINKLLQTSLYSVLFLSFPVFLLGQTVPLVSNYFSRAKLSEITGKMLFFSTAGSFLGSVFSTIVLMSFVGVHNTIIVTMSLLCLLILLLNRKFFCFETILCLMVMTLIYSMNSNNTMRHINIVSSNPYNTVMIADIPKDETRLLLINRSSSSRINTNKDHNSGAFPYINYVEDNFITPTLKTHEKPMEFLVIGAGGFTVGLEDKFNHYTFVDIDPALKDTAEEYFLKEKLSDNKQFIASSARAFIHNTDKKYDLVFIDVYSNKISIPMECTTREFFLDVKALLKENAVVVSNFLGNPGFTDKFSVRYHNTFASVFPVFNRQVIEAENKDKILKDSLNKEVRAKNIVYVYHNNKYTDDNTIYTDDKNTYSLDMP